MVTISVILLLFYNTLLSTALWHVFYTIIHSGSKNWITCDNKWNTPCNIE